MPLKEQYLRWQWRLKSSPETLWPFVSDSNRLNYDRGNVPLVAGPRQRNNRRPLQLGSFKYDEEPFEWMRPSRFGVNRIFPPDSPLFDQLRLRADLEPQPNGGTLFTYQFWIRPRTRLGVLGIPLFMRQQYKAFDAAILNYDRVASLPRPSPFEVGGKVTFSPGGRERLAQLRRDMIAQEVDAALLDKLIHIVETADELAAARLRPYELADLWGAPRRAVLELCLRATRSGLLEFRWEVLCPLCRGAKESAAALGQMKSQLHCDSCNIDITANFDRSVEVTFRPNPAIRHSEVSEFCVGSPQLTPHIVAQQLMPAGETRALTLPLEPGRYRLRALELPGGQFMIAAPSGATDLTARAGPDGWPESEFHIDPNPTLRLVNDTAEEQLLILERTAWNDQAVTAAEVTALQLFRDLFADEALRPGEQISVGSLTVLFTDLRESTRLYREVGDAVAFGRVMSHFDVLREAINAEQGAVVKTIGDSVMAVFIRPINAVRAALRAQYELSHSANGAPPLHLKAGIHYGPCIAVTLNERLDYFGTTVNITARLEGQSPTGGIVISAEVRRDPEVVTYFDSARERVDVESFQGVLKGFGEARFELWRVTAKGDPPSV